MDKTPYELRTELLHMARDILESKAKRLAENEYQKPEGTRQPVEPYNAQDVIKVAKELNVFISKG
jgi:hypothetical protein